MRISDDVDVLAREQIEPRVSRVRFQERPVHVARPGARAELENAGRQQGVNLLEEQPEEPRIWTPVRVDAERRLDQLDHVAWDAPPQRAHQLAGAAGAQD